MAGVWGTLKAWTHHLQRSLRCFTQFYEQVMIAVVVINTTTEVALTFERVAVTAVWHITALEPVFLAFYTMECVFKIMTFGLLYFKSVWNVVDLFITMMGMVDLILPLINHGKNVASGHISSFFRLLKIFKGLRAIRVFRILRALSMFQGVKFFWNCIKRSIWSIGVISGLTISVFLMFSIIFRETFVKSDPERFGSMLNTVSALIQVLTLDEWINIYYTSRDNGARYIIIFLVLFIFIEYFIFFNEILAVIMDNFELVLKGVKPSNIQKDVNEGEKQSSKTDHTSSDQADEQFYAETLQVTFPENQFSKRKRGWITHYLRLLAAVEQKQQKFRSQADLPNRLIECMCDKHTNLEWRDGN